MDEAILREELILQSLRFLLDRVPMYSIGNVLRVCARDVLQPIFVGISAIPAFDKRLQGTFLKQWL